MNQRLSTSIIQTLVYYDLFFYPLTASELYRWLWQHHPRVSYLKLLAGLDHLTGRVLEHHSGFFMLKGRADLVEKRQAQRLLVERKMRIAKRAVKKLRWIPGLRAVFVCNQLESSAKAESDIDVCIVCAHGRLWFVRFWSIVLLSISRLRITKTKSQDKICLSFFLSEKKLSLQKITIKEPDVYLVYWLDQLIPVYDHLNITRQMIQKNSWAQAYLDQSRRLVITSDQWQVVDNAIVLHWKRMIEPLLSGFVGEGIERLVKRIQQKKLQQKNIPDGKGVVINDAMLKFHQQDRREFFQTQWQQQTDVWVNQI